VKPPTPRAMTLNPNVLGFWEDAGCLALIRDHLRALALGSICVFDDYTFNGDILPRVDLSLDLGI